jgi:cytochrome o ubiquinol oxidase subunit II
MMTRDLLRLGRRVAPLAAVLLLGGCGAAILEPGGDVARQERDLLLESTGLMLLIIIPVMVLTVMFAFRYRASNKSAHYDPDFDHSTQLELYIWSAPLLIIIALGALTWLGTHTLDPYRPLDRLDEMRAVDPKTPPLEVDVVAMDWKWLFIYPQYGVATVNELAAPVDRPIHFKITATSIMNTLSIPAISGMVYAMPSMQTTLYAVINRPGVYTGFSGHYSGAGFSDMNFRAYGVSPQRFDQWIGEVKRAPLKLDRQTYLTLVKPTIAVPPAHFATFEPGLFQRILMQCEQPGGQCMTDGTVRNSVTEGALATGGGPSMGNPNQQHPKTHNEQPMTGAGLPPPKLAKPSPASSPLLNAD